MLNFDPAAQQEKSCAEFIEHLKRLMILTALADGRVEPAEIDAIRKSYQGFSGVALSGPEIERRFPCAASEDHARGLRATFAGNLTEQGKELVIKAVHPVLVAGGEWVPTSTTSSTIWPGVNLSGAHFRGILAELGA